MFSGKKIIVGITGSIAAYKAITLVRLLVKSGAEVKVIATPAALDFVTPLTLSTLSKNKVLTGLFDEYSWADHVMLGRWADAIIIAPASCNTLSKMAGGQCDNLLLAVYLSATCPVLIAPAMDEDMWKHPAIRLNVERLTSYGNTLLPVSKGELASGLTGDGRMAEPEEIMQYIQHAIVNTGDLKGARALVTSGPTYEAIDPVRYISNHSSGKMGIAIANALAERGATVTLVSGPSHLKASANIETVPVISAAEMYEACMRFIPGADIIIMAAAVADYAPVAAAQNKIKKTEDNMVLNLKRTEDILKKAGELKNLNQILVGFALETDEEEANAKKKLIEKNADMIVLNSHNNRNPAFQSGTNKITIFDKLGKEYYFESKSKKEVARDIIDTVMQYKKLLKVIVVIGFILSFWQQAKAQELRARVSVISNRVGNSVDQKTFVTLRSALNDFINTRKWTDNSFQAVEKIDCNFLFNLELGADANVYKASLTVQAARPVFNSSYASPIINFQDNDITFKYVEYQQLDFNENRISGTDALVSNLTAVIAYYINLIIGLDYDSFAPRGGDQYLQKAQNIVNNAPDGRNISGWKAFDGNRSRYWLAENLLNSRYTLIHDAYYAYYRLGLDNMYSDEVKARAEVLNVLSLLNTFNVDNPNTMILQFFFQGKSQELLKLFSKASAAEKTRALDFLQKLDITNSAKYKEGLK